MNEVFNRLNSIMCSIFVLIVIVLCTIFSISSLIFRPKGDISFFIMKVCCKLILWFCRVEIHIEGLENIDKDKIQIFASNHSSHFDVIVIISILPVQVGWIAKKELFKIPFLGWIMKANRYISIDRESGRKALASLNSAAEKIRKGNRIVMFPEGTRSRDGELLPFKKGLFHLCVRTGIPVIPIYIQGTNEVLKPDTLMINPGKVYVRIGKEINTSSYSVNKTRAMMNDLRENVLRLQEEVREFQAYQNL